MALAFPRPLSSPTQVPAAADFYLDFYWPNDSHVHTEGPYNLPAGGSYAYDMDTAGFGEGTYAGYVVIGGDEQPVAGRITSPDYGLISGIVYESDGSTPLQINDVSVNRHRMTPGSAASIT